MTKLITAYDAVTVENLPHDAEYAFYYTDGQYANEAGVRKQCPHAVLCSITVLPGRGAGMCDCEPEDLTVEQAEAWVESELKAGAYRPRVYADQDRWENQGLMAGLAKYGDRIRRAVAAYDGKASIPSGYDAHQYKTNGIDTWVCLPDFFDDKAPVVKPHGTVRFEGSLDLNTGKWTIRGIPGVHTSFAGPQKWACAEIGIQIGKPNGGEWRIVSLPYDTKPIGT